MAAGTAKLTIILGCPASGKTTLARRLARELGQPYVSKDDVKEGLFEALGTGDRSWSRRLSEASFAAAVRLAGAQLSLGLSCILEGNWRAAHAGALGAVIAAAGADARQIWCLAEPEEIARRFASRRRHPGHLDALLGATEIEQAAREAPAFIDLPGTRRIFPSDRPAAYGELLMDLQSERL